MKCLYCGAESENILCENCRTAANLEYVFRNLIKFDEEICENIHLKEYVQNFEKSYMAIECIPQLLSLFPEMDTSYYYCLYYAEERDEKFEETALRYIAENNMSETKTQHVFYHLLDTYSRKYDMYSPAPWCEMVKESNNMLFDIYVKATEYYSRIGEYDAAQKILNQAVLTAVGGDNHRFFVFKPENAVYKTDRLKSDLDRYKSGKPYWPSTEDRRKIIAEFYDKKGISHPRIGLKPIKVKESDFVPPQITYSMDENNFSSFWCDEAFTVSGVRAVYSIAAVKVRDGKISDTFTSFINPNEGTATIKDAAKKAGVNAEVIKSAPDVDLVMTDFFKFVGDDVLVSTTIGSQRQLLSRCARYTAMTTITNNLFGLDDLAEEMGMEETDRQALTKFFGLQEGSTTLEKAELNITLFRKINEYE